MDPISQRNDDAWQRAQAPASTGGTTPTPTQTVAPKRATAPADYQPPMAIDGDPHMRKFVESAAALASMQPDAHDVETRRKLDAFMATATAPYQMPDGSMVSVTPPFKMAPGYPAQWKSVPQKSKDLRAAAARADIDQATLNRIEAARGTPTEVHALTQALLSLPSAGKSMTAGDVRKLMFDCGIGIDCAGFARAAYLHVTGRTGTEAGFKAADVEDLSGLGARGFQRVTDPAAARPGDLMVLAPNEERVGHRGIVYDSRRATAADIQELVPPHSLDEPSAGDRVAKAKFAVGGPIRVVEVDSSWGSGGQHAVGGVQRVKLFHNESTGQWGWDTKGADGRSYFQTSDLPYAHPLDGFYRRGS